VDNTTIPGGGARGDSKPDEVAAIHWVHPKPRRPYPLLETRIVVGRGASCQVQFEGSSVSRRHCEVYRQGPIYAIHDLSSTNGTYLNGQLIKHAAIARGDVVRMGEYVGVIGTIPARGDCVEFSELQPGFLGGASLAKQLDAVRRVAMSKLPIMLIGETGVGKEHVVRAIHGWTARTGDLCVVNCVSLRADQAERELFGSFETASGNDTNQHLGYFQRAQAGTLFFDEVGELALPVQAQLRRVLEDGMFTAPGQSHGVPVDVQIVATSQRDLSELTARGEFRNDLYARLSGASITLPPLRERREDIAPTFVHFLAHYASSKPPTCSAELVEALCLYSWPRNVHELKNLARQLVALHGDAGVLECSFLPTSIRGQRSASEPAPIGLSAANRREHDLQLLIAALRRTEGNVKAAAASLGFSRQRAYRLMNGRDVDELLSQPSAGGVLDEHDD
jgi:sigma-54 dependent transcriptional regulator, acetoin dehydrogenase operon transcriptional activator AcoR